MRQSCDLFTLGKERKKGHRKCWSHPEYRSEKLGGVGRPDFLGTAVEGGAWGVGGRLGGRLKSGIGRMKNSFRGDPLVRGHT